MKPHESPQIRKNQFVAIQAIRCLCEIGVLKNNQVLSSFDVSPYFIFLVDASTNHFYYSGQ